MMGIKIYRRDYDNHLNDDGTEKPNELLGEFENISGDMRGYSYVCYGEMNGDLYKIIGHEISGFNGGTLNKVEKLTNSPDVQALLKFLGIEIPA